MTTHRTPHTSLATLGSLLRICAMWAVAIGVVPFALDANAQQTPIPDWEGRVGYDVYAIHLEEYLGVPHDGCFGRSSDESVAQVIVQGYRVRVIPVGAGTATITVGGTTRDGTIVQDTFEVSVTYPPPGVGGPLQDAEVRVTQSLSVDVKNAFTGRVDDLIATVSPAGHAMASVARSRAEDGTATSMLTLMGVAHGPVTVTLTASNGGGSTDRSFQLMVRDIPPAMGDALADSTVRVTESTAVDLSTAFTGTALSYAATVSPETAASADLDGTSLTLTGLLATPEATVTVTASNNEGSLSQEFMLSVRDIPPEVGEQLADTTVRVTEYMMVDLTNAFSGTGLSYNVVVSPDTAAGAMVDGTTLALSGLVASHAMVTVTATNTEDSAEQSFALHVRDIPPEVAEELADTEVRVTESMTMDLADAFSGTALSYAATVSPDTAASAVIDGTTLTLSGHLASMATVTVTATNTEDSAEQSFGLHVRDIPPEVDEQLADTEVRVTEYTMVDLTNAFSGTALSYTAMVSPDTAASASVDGTTLTLSGLVASHAMVTVTATNTEDSAEQSFALHVRDIPPEVAEELADTEVRVTESMTVDLADAFSGTALSYAATVSPDTAASAVIDGTTLTLSGHLASMATVTVTATNTEDSAEQSFGLHVRDIPPEVDEQLADTEVRVTEYTMVDLTNAFSGTTLSYTAMVSPDTAASASVDGTTLTLSGLVAGASTVTVTATNTEDSAAQTFALHVRDIPPEVDEEIADTTVRVTESTTIDLTNAFSGTALSYMAMVSPETAATAAIEGTTLTVSGLVAGAATVTVTATNSEDSAEQTFMLTVEDIPPAVAEVIGDVTVRATESMTVDLSGAFSGTALEYSAMSASEDMATASVDGTMLTIMGVAAGPTTVTVTATNTAGSASQDVAVTVEDIPPAVAEPLEAATVLVGSTVMVDLTDAFSGTALSYSAVSASDAMATVSVDGAMVAVTGVAAGPVTVMVTATNTAGSASQDLEVTVEDVPPEVAEMLPDIEIRVGDTMEMDLSGAFTGSALQYSAMSSSDAMATVSVTGTSLSVTGVAAGGASVTVMAMNSADTAQQSFAVNVRDVPPGTTAAIPDVHLVAGGAPAVIDLGNHFSGSALVFGATVSDVAVTASVAGAHLTVAPANEGSATVTVTATNTEGVISASFNAMVTTDAAEVDAIERSLAAIAGATLSSVNSAFQARFRGSASKPAAASSLAFDSAPGEYLGPSGGVAAVGSGLDWNGTGWYGGNGSQWGDSGWSGSRGGAYGYGNGGWMDGYPRSGGLFGPSRPMGGQSFIMPLAASGGSGGMGEFSLWGHADWQSFEAEGIDGDLTSVYIGADVTIGEQWLVGVAASQSDGDVDYRFAGQAASGRGSLTTEMLSIFPYAKYSVDDCTELWAILGFGSGDIESRRSVVTRTSEADLTMSLASVGGNRVISSGEGWSVTFLGDASTIRMDTDGITGAIQNVDVNVTRIRAGLQGARTIEMDDGSSFEVFGEVAARNDSGDGQTGGGAEISAGVRFNTTARFSLEFKGRLLGTHSEDDVEESAFSVSAMLLPESNGGGLSLALSSRQGADFGISGIMPGRDYDAMRRARGIADDWGLDARIGYGLPDTGLPGLLTPFVKVDAGSSHRRGARIGARFDAGGRLVRHLTIEAAAGTAYHFFDDSMAGLFELRGEVRF